MRKRTVAEPDGWDMQGGGPFGWRPGQPTDDTGLTIAVAYAHLDVADGGNTRLAAWDRMLDWYDGTLLGEGFPKDVGGATSRALSTGRPDLEALGNGALMRCSPTALLDNPADRAQLTAEIARLTHPHPWSVAACVAYNEMARALVDGCDVDDAVQAGIDACDRAHCPDVGDAIYWADHNRNTAAQLTDNGAGYVIDSLILAVAALRARTFGHGLVWVIRHGRDTDTNGAIAGGLLGARFGAAAIPARWAEACEWGGWLTATADSIR